MITCIVELPNTNVEADVSYVYAVNCTYVRRILLEEINGLARDPIISSKSWVLLGDFNQTLHPFESSTSLSDLPFRGNVFTWWNNQESNLISKKLDRIMVNDLW